MWLRAALAFFRRLCRTLRGFAFRLSYPAWQKPTDSRHIVTTLTVLQRRRVQRRPAHCLQAWIDPKAAPIDLWQFVDCDLRAWHAGQSAYRGRSQCNDDSIGIELEGLEGLAFEPAQYRTLATLCQDIARRYPIAHIAGHEHIAPGRKQDPGPGFDWVKVQKALRWPPHRFPAATRPAILAAS